MRYALIIGFVTTGCANETVIRGSLPPVDWQSLEARPTSNPGSPRTTAKERAIAERYTAALGSPEFSKLHALLDEDIHFAFAARETHGRDRVIKAHADLLGALDERAVYTSRVWLTDRSQVLEWTLTGIQARSWLGVSATGKSVSFKGLALLWTKDDGSITDIHLYFDEGVAKAQLGVGPPELAMLPLPNVHSSPPDVFEQGNNANEASNEKLVRSMLQALEDNKEPEYLATFSDDIEVFTLDRAEPTRGKEEARAYFRKMRKSIGLLDTVTQNTWAVGDSVVIEYLITGLQQARLKRVPYSAGKALRTQFVDIAEVHDGTIHRIWRYADPDAFPSL
jgi:ketosteroid isomerase-like protein